MYFADKKKKKFFGKKGNMRKNNVSGASGGGSGFFSNQSGFLTGAAIGFAAALAGFLLYREAVTTPVFEVSAIEFKGVFHASESELLEMSGIRKGENIFFVKSSAAVDAIKTHPYVEKAEVAKKLPNEIVVTVKERVPAFLVKAGALYIMDSGGELFKEYEKEDNLDLPIVTGPGGKGSDGWLDEMKPALKEFALALEQSDALKMTSVSEIHLDPVMGISVYTLKEGVRIEFGTGNFSGKLKDLGEFLAKRSGNLAGIESIDLNNKRGVVVRLTTAAV